MIMAENLLIVEFPKTILKLNELLESPDFANTNLSNVHENINIPLPDAVHLNHNAAVDDASGNGNVNDVDIDDNQPRAKKPKLDNCLPKSGTRVYALPNGSVACNRRLCDLINLVKPHIRKLVEDSNLVSFKTFPPFF